MRSRLNVHVSDQKKIRGRDMDDNREEGCPSGAQNIGSTSRSRRKRHAKKSGQSNRRRPSPSLDADKGNAQYIYVEPQSGFRCTPVIVYTLLVTVTITAANILIVIVLYYNGMLQLNELKSKVDLVKHDLDNLKQKGGQYENDLHLRDIKLKSIESSIAASEKVIAEINSRQCRHCERYADEIHNIIGKSLYTLEAKVESLENRNSTVQEAHEDMCTKTVGEELGGAFEDTVVAAGKSVWNTLRSAINETLN